MYNRMSVERDRYIKHIPFCETRIALVDQYMFPEKDTTERLCNNGVSHPIYSCNGNISRTLPLTMYPAINEVHPQIRASSQPHFMARDSMMARMIEQDQLDRARGRLEGFYMGGGEFDPYRRREQVLSSRWAGAPDLSSQSCGQPGDPVCPLGQSCFISQRTGKGRCMKSPQSSN